MINVKKLYQAVLYALRGVKLAVLEQKNIQIQLVASIVVISMGVYFNISKIEWCILFLTIGLVLGLEIVNSAIENLVDLVTKEHHPLAGKVKDMAAGAVLVASFLSVVIGVIIFAKYLVGS